MALVAVEGVYRHGVIELAERPNGVQEARVVVTFLPIGSDAEAALKDTEREAARQRVFERMERGIDFKGYRFSREQIYEERLQELEERRNR